MTAASEDLAQIRDRIDALDEQIVALLGERERWVVAAGAHKRDEDGVRAPDRVEQVVAKVRARAAQRGASPHVVEQTYRAMIAAFVELELGVHRAKPPTS